MISVLPASKSMHLIKGRNLRIHIVLSDGREQGRILGCRLRHGQVRSQIGARNFGHSACHLQRPRVRIPIPTFRPKRLGGGAGIRTHPHVIVAALGIRRRRRHGRPRRERRSGWGRRRRRWRGRQRRGRRWRWRGRRRGRELPKAHLVVIVIAGLTCPCRCDRRCMMRRARCDCCSPSGHILGRSDRRCTC